MPGIANITTANAAAASVSFDVATPSSGDNTWAVWIATALSTIRAYRPKFSMLARSNNGKSGRKISMKLEIPYVVTISGVSNLVATHSFFIETTIPDQLPDTVILDNVCYLQGIMASAEVTGALQSQYAPS
jgi:hypothetical protein